MGASFARMSQSPEKVFTLAAVGWWKWGRGAQGDRYICPQLPRQSYESQKQPWPITRNIKEMRNASWCQQWVLGRLIHVSYLPTEMHFDRFSSEREIERQLVENLFRICYWLEGSCVVAWVERIFFLIVELFGFSGTLPSPVDEQTPGTGRHSAQCKDVFVCTCRLFSLSFSSHLWLFVWTTAWSMSNLLSLYFLEFFT